jgi:ubiquitin-conjugating enzyme E2 Z
MDIDNKEPIILQKEMIQRLIKDVKQIKKNPLIEHNIYYHHDEENILKGYALIIGPENTPYFGGYYLFELNFPIDYPHSPPILHFITNGENIRFNPNLYVNGKVCISLLNTWRGEQWTSCQTISTVLLTLGTLFINDPLLNEPGITKTHNDFHKYTNIITYKNIDIAIINVIKKNPKNYYSKYPFVQHFDTIIREKFLENKNKIISFIEPKKNNDIELIKTNIYNMSVAIDYNRLYEKICNINF